MVVLTFDPHPLRVLCPEKAPRLLTALSHKVALLNAYGADHVLVLPFTVELSRQSPEEFLERLLSAARPLREICVGHQWSFGKDRRGNIEFLREHGSRHGFDVVSIPPVTIDGAAVSSTRIREAIQRGDFETARRCLGREYTILGTVRRGAQLGSKLGFPTANLAAHNEQFPPDGVYAVHAKLEGVDRPGVANIGVRPTVDAAGERVLEVHLLDFKGDFYGATMEVRFERFLRNECRFESLEALKTQIARDAEAARAIFKGG